MITNKDLEIENISYTNKDFGQIYPELVELAKNLTNKWDPTSTNESDPGIVLLKLIAFLGDKLNYNIDKNALEQFITSATQESSMRELTEMLGYNMNYYRSAISTVTFRYLGDMGNTEEDESNPLASSKQITLKAFDTTFKTDDDVVYTLLSDLTVYSEQKYTPLGSKCIQGQLSELSLTGTDSNLIQLYNLDDNRRIYFPDVEVAENGIFINKDDGIYDEVYNTDVWHRVDSLNDQELGQKIFKFGFDSNKGFPYIQFPKDISDLIGDGLSISYIISNGILGKVTNGKLSTINSSKIIYIDQNNNSNTYNTTLDSSTYLLNNSTSTEAKDPETINEAYINFKNTIGTFNTLVSCRDYSNYLRSYIDDLNNRLVSNVQVTDVRTDPSYSKEIMTRNSTGNTLYTHELINVDKYNSLDLILHGTTPVNSTINTLNIYNSTYNSLTDSDLATINSNNNLSNAKTLVHTFKLPELNDLDYIEARYKLFCNIILKSSLSSAEQLSVLQDIRQALYSSYNSINVDFGEEIPYDDIIDVIKNANTNIKSVVLDTPTITYYAKLHNSTNSYKELSVINADSKDLISKYLADNILAGRLPLWAEDKTFYYDYDIDLSSKDSLISYENLAGIYAQLNIDAITDTSDNYTLRKNEGLQIIQDAYITQVSYPAYVYYSFTTNRVDTGSLAISANQIYKLQENELLYIQYTDSSDIVQYITYKEGDVIKPTFDIVNLQNIAKISNSEVTIENKVASKFVNWAGKKIYKDLNYSEYEKNRSVYSAITPLYAIGTNEQIDLLKINSAEIPSMSKCFWYIKPKVLNTDDANVITDNDNNDLKFVEIENNNYSEGYKYMYILEEGEYLVYPTDDMLSLNILGSGTKILSKVPSISRSNRNIIDLSLFENSILDQDVGTFEKSYSWEYLPSPLLIIGTSISSFIEGDIIKKCPALNSQWQSITSDSIEIADNDLSLSNYANPLARTLLSVVCSNSNPQNILENQSIYIYKCSDSKMVEASTFIKETLSAGDLIQISSSIDSYNNMTSLGELQYEQIGTILQPSLDKKGRYLYNFSYSAIKYKEKEIAGGTSALLSDFILKAKQNSSVIFNSRYEYVIPKDIVENLLGTAKQITCDIDESYGLKISVFNSYEQKTVLMDCAIDTNIDLTTFIDKGESTDSLYLSIPKKLSIYPYLSDIQSEILSIINQYPTFDCFGDQNTYKLITSYTPLYSYLDKNNIYNKLTIAKIDFENSLISIVGGTRSW